MRLRSLCVFLLPLSTMAACAPERDDMSSSAQEPGDISSSAQELTGFDGNRPPGVTVPIPTISTVVNPGDYPNTVGAYSPNAWFTTTWTGSPAYFYVQFDGYITYQTVTAPVPNGSVTFGRDTSGLSEGYHTVTSTAGNSLGQVSGHSVQVLIDRTMPRVSVVPGPGLTFKIYSSDNYGMAKLAVILDDQQYSPAVTYYNQLEATYTAPSTLAVGNHSLYVRANDKAGNIAWSNTVNFTVYANRAPVFATSTPTGLTSTIEFVCPPAAIPQAVSQRFTATDPDGDAVTFALVTATGTVPPGMTITPAGDFTWDGKAWEGAEFTYVDPWGSQATMTLGVVAKDSRGGSASWPVALTLQRGPYPSCALPLGDEQP